MPVHDGMRGGCLCGPKNVAYKGSASHEEGVSDAGIDGYLQEFAEDGSI